MLITIQGELISMNSLSAGFGICVCDLCEQDIDLLTNLDEDLTKGALCYLQTIEEDDAHPARERVLVLTPTEINPYGSEDKYQKHLAWTISVDDLPRITSTDRKLFISKLRELGCITPLAEDQLHWYVTASHF